jgi:hypothetical protein
MFYDVHLLSGIMRVLRWRLKCYGWPFDVRKYTLRRQMSHFVMCHIAHGEHLHALWEPDRVRKQTAFDSMMDNDLFGRITQGNSSERICNCLFFNARSIYKKVFCKPWILFLFLNTKYFRGWDIEICSTDCVSKKFTIKMTLKIVLQSKVLVMPSHLFLEV